MAVTKDEIRLKVRKLLARVTGRKLSEIGGNDNLGDPPPLGMDSYKTKGLKQDINEILEKYGDKPRITLIILGKMHKNKKVKDLEDVVYKMAAKNESNSNQ